MHDVRHTDGVVAVGANPNTKKTMSNTATATTATINTTPTPTNAEIASSWRLWIEYVDPAGCDSRESFGEMSQDEKIKIIRECFEQ